MLYVQTCLLILFKEYFIIPPIRINTVTIAIIVGIIGKVYCISIELTKAKYIVYEPNIPSGTPINIAFVP